MFSVLLPVSSPLLHPLETENTAGSTRGVQTLPATSRQHHTRAISSPHSRCRFLVASSPTILEHGTLEPLISASETLSRKIRDRRATSTSAGNDERIRRKNSRHARFPLFFLFFSFPSSLFPPCSPAGVD